MTYINYPHWSKVPASVWPYPNFSPKEIACKDSGSIKIKVEAMEKLQALRTAIGKPLSIVSGYRSPAHNAAVDGAPQSKHMLGEAFDVSMVGHDPAEFAKAALAAGFVVARHYPESRFTHIDLGPYRTW